MDETSNAFNCQYKCITPDSDNHPFVETPKKRSHMTVGLYFNAARWKMKPLIILSGLRHLSNKPRHFASNTYFSTQYSGWMTRHLFAIWAIYFAHELSFYRAALAQYCAQNGSIDSLIAIPIESTLRPSGTSMPIACA
jgi:hypothetical protein